MSGPGAYFTVALRELQQVSDTISQGADFFESQISEGLQVARYALKGCSVTESTKAYAKEVLQAATQHLLNIADLLDGTIADRSQAVDELDTNCQVALQSIIASQAQASLYHLSALQTPMKMHRYPKVYSPAAFEAFKMSAKGGQAQ